MSALASLLLASLLPELLLEPTGDEKLRSEDNDLASSLLAPAFVLKAGQTPAFFFEASFINSFAFSPDSKA
jgi:hypothetical protein